LSLQRAVADAIYSGTWRIRGHVSGCRTDIREMYLENEDEVVGAIVDMVRSELDPKGED